MVRAPIAWDQLAARQGVFANDLPSNRELPNDVTLESLEPGWTAQQPYAHLICAVTPTCVLCGDVLDRLNWGAHVCRVETLLGAKLWADDSD